MNLPRPHETPTILMVDDDPVFLSASAATVRRGGLIVHTANGSAQALTHFEHHRPTVLVTDMEMPGMDGVELFQALRDRHPLMRGILCSAYVDADNLLRIARSGIHSVMCKAGLQTAMLRQAIFAQIQESDRWRELLGTVPVSKVTRTLRRVDQQRTQSNEPAP